MWKQRDGVLIRVSDMSERHVRAAFRMLIRRFERHEANIKIMEALTELHMIEPPAKPKPDSSGEQESNT